MPDEIKIDREILQRDGIEASLEVADRLNKWSNGLQVMAFNQDPGIILKSIVYEVECDGVKYFFRKIALPGGEHA